MNEFISVKDYLKAPKKIKTNYKDKERTKTKLYTFIESGKYKGKKLLLPNLEKTRSTKSIVKTCVFNVLRQNLKDKIFIEAFGGSALMAAEALSNNAYKAYAIELDKNAYKIALENAKIDNNLKIINADTFEFFPKLLENLKQENTKIILYLDPPFDIRTGFGGIYEKIYNFLINLNLENIEKIIFEHNSNITMPEKIKEFSKNKFKKFGSTALSFYEKFDL